MICELFFKTDKIQDWKISVICEPYFMHETRYSCRISMNISVLCGLLSTTEGDDCEHFCDWGYFVHNQ